MRERQLRQLVGDDRSGDNRGGDDRGGDDRGRGGAATTAASGGGAATTVAATGKTGDPIKVMTETAIDTNLTPYENIRDASKYYAQWVNEQGGIVDGNGTKHKLEVTFCDDKYDANESANCARTAVDNKLIANIGGFTIDASRAIPIYEENKVAWFGVCCPIVDQENKSPISFPLGFVGGLPDCRGDQDERRRLQEGRRRLRRPAGRRGVPQPVPQRLEVGRAHRPGDDDQVPARPRRLQLAGRADTRRRGLLLRQHR